MIIYNVTIKIDNDVHEEWILWMRSKHIPSVMATGLFIDNKICKVLTDETDGTTYSIQYSCQDMNDYEKYQNDHASNLQKEHTEKYKDKFVAFRTLLEVLSN